MEVAQVDDAKIIALFFKRNEESIKETKQKYNRYSESVAQNIPASRGEAEECVSDTYLARGTAFRQTSRTA